MDGPPDFALVIDIFLYGREKHGWHWLKRDGYWWGANKAEQFILQVCIDPPEYPAREWMLNLGGGFTPGAKWEPVMETIQWLRICRGPKGKR